MRLFLRDYWLWIVLPLAIVLAGVGFLILVGAESDSPFVYDVQGSPR